MNSDAPVRIKAHNELASHPIAHALLDSLTPFLSELDTMVLSESDHYNLDVFQATSALLQSVELLERCRNFVARVPSSDGLLAFEINRHDWLEHHISSFVIGLVTVGDQLLVLVNEVFRLGNEPKGCRPNIIKGNKWVRETSVVAQLDAVEKIIGPHRKTRNRFVHMGKTPPLGALFKSENLDQLKMISFAAQHKPGLFTDDKLAQAYENELPAIDKVLSSELSSLATSIWDLLDSLAEHRDKQLALLSNGTLK